MEILDGKKVSNELIDNLRVKIKKLDRKLKLVILDILGNVENKLYIKNKIRICDKLNVDYEVIEFDKNVDESYILKQIERLNKDITVDGIIIELPIPKKFNLRKLLNAISPKKDVDSLNSIKVSNNIMPCTPSGILELLEYYKIYVSGKNVVILGRSELVGKPLFNALINMDATVTLCHSKTKDIKIFTKNADILISAVGKSKIINKEHIKKDVIIIDVGINYVDGNICGDVDFESVKDIVSYITPVPGGVGPMTVYEVLNNLYKLRMENKDV